MDLCCNQSQCRKVLGGISDSKACITTCSHIFCLSCARTSFSSALVCPACDTSLPRRDDILSVDMNPSEDYKSCVLAGLSPDVIAEICARSLAFWQYQMTQESALQKALYVGLDEKCVQLEQEMRALNLEAQRQVHSVTDQLHHIKSCYESERKKVATIQDGFAEKARQLQKLQLAYDKLKKKSNNIHGMSTAGQQSQPAFTVSAQQYPTQYVSRNSSPQSGHQDQSRSGSSRSQDHHHQKQQHHNQPSTPAWMNKHVRTPIVQNIKQVPNIVDSRLPWWKPVNTGLMNATEHHKNPTAEVRYQQAPRTSPIGRSYRQ